MPTDTEQLAKEILAQQDEQPVRKVPAILSRYSRELAQLAQGYLDMKKERDEAERKVKLVGDKQVTDYERLRVALREHYGSLVEGDRFAGLVEDIERLRGKLINANCEADSQQAKLKAAEEALMGANSVIQGFEMHVGGRMPADSSDKMGIETIHARRICALLNVIHPALATIRAKASDSHTVSTSSQQPTT